MMDQVKKLSEPFTAILVGDSESELNQGSCTMQLRKGHRVTGLRLLPNGVYAFRGFYDRRYLSRTQPPIE